MSSEKSVVAFLERFRGSLSQHSYVRMIEAGAESIRNDIDTFSKELFAEQPKRARKPRAAAAEPTPQDGDSDESSGGRQVTADDVLLHLKVDGGDLSVSEIRKQLRAELNQEVDGASVSKAIKSLVKDGRVLWTGGAKRAAKYKASTVKREEAEEAS